MLGMLFTKRTKREMELADSIRAMETVRVSKRGGISLDSSEILRDQNFINASERAKKIVAAS